MPFCCALCKHLPPHLVRVVARQIQVARVSCTTMLYASGLGSTRARYTAETVPGDSDVGSLYTPLNRDLRMHTYGDDVLKKAILDAWRHAVRLWQCSVVW